MSGLPCLVGVAAVVASVVAVVAAVAAVDVVDAVVDSAVSARTVAHCVARLPHREKPLCCGARDEEH